MQMVAPCAMQFAQQVHDRFAVLRVEVSGRLVREQDGRLSADGAGHGDALLLTAGELRGQVLRAVRHADALERGVGALTALGRLHAAVDQRQLDVLEDREVANQVEALEDEPDFAVAHARALGERQVGDLIAVEQVLARPWACRAGRESPAAWTCRSPTVRRWRRIRPAAISRWMPARAWVSTSSV